MNAPLQPMHSPFGGSVAARVLRCPASVRLVEKVPANLRRSSAYADRGTALHFAMPRLIEHECSLDDLVGETIGDYASTRDDVENFLRPVLAWVDELLDHPEAEYFIEHRVVFPFPGAFGTADLIVRIGRTIYVVDFKFGAGVRVVALYPDDDEDVINGQLLFYAVAARHSLPGFFTDVDDIILTILQPQSIEPDAEMVSSVTVTHDELDEFGQVYRAACAEALSETPRLARGDWCRFCPAKPICPLHTGPLLDLAQFAIPACPPLGGAPPDKAAYLKLLAAGLNLAAAVKEIAKSLHDQAKVAIESGDDVPDFALTAGRAVRAWRDEATVAPALLKLGLARDDVVIEELRSPKQVEARAKAHGVKVPQELISSKPSGVSLVKAENAHAPILGRGELAREFSEALQAFQQGGKSNDRP